MSTINEAYNTNIEMEPKTCLLGYVNEELYPWDKLIPIGRLLFIARKIIARKWMSSNRPVFEEWHSQVNATILMEQQVYKNRGRIDILAKLWGPWVTAPGLAFFSLAPLEYHSNDLSYISWAETGWTGCP